MVGNVMGAPTKKTSNISVEYLEYLLLNGNF